MSLCVRKFPAPFPSISRRGGPGLTMEKPAVARWATLVTSSRNTSSRLWSRSATAKMHVFHGVYPPGIGVEGEGAMGLRMNADDARWDFGTCFEPWGFLGFLVSTGAPVHRQGHGGDVRGEHNGLTRPSQHKK